MPAPASAPGAGYPIGAVPPGTPFPPACLVSRYDGPAAVTMLEVVADSGGETVSDELCTEYEEDGTHLR